MADAPMLEMKGITKRFPGVLANDDVNFDLQAGEVHTLLGENGAGKSTLMKVLYGLYQPDLGEIFLNGELVQIGDPTVAIDHNIGMIHQHFMLVETLTVAENVALGLPSSRRPLTDLNAVSERIVELGGQYGLDVDPSALVWQLAVGQKQRVEIIKALYRDARLLILDEPTAVLTPQEVDQLFGTLRQLTADGCGLIFISHKLHEVLALSDRITVLRNGRVTGNTTTEGATRHSLAEMMVGREVKLAPDKPDVAVGSPGLVISDLEVIGDRGNVVVDGLNLEVFSGEILGIAGVSGNGQRELAETIGGLRQSSGGTVTIAGKDVTNGKPIDMRHAGLAYVPEGRMKNGSIGSFTVAENLLLIDYQDSQFLKRGLYNFSAIRPYCMELVDDFDVKTPTIDTTVKSLSGGNIQKLIMARELSGTPEVLIASQPTRGVDIGAAEYIHIRLVEQREQGTAILMISEDLDEIFALSDRIAVLYEGRIMAILDPADATREEIGLLMAGVSPAAVPEGKESG